MKQFMNNLIITAMLLFSSLTHAETGFLFKIAESGAAASADVILCLNGKGPLSCQNYHISAATLAINTTVNHHYPAAGIKVLTPGYKATGCTPYPNGYCLFVVNSQTPAKILLNSNIPSNHKVGGTILGLVGSVSLQNNGGDTLTQSSDGNFEFTTPVAQGASYNVTVSSPPATQTCTVNNGTGTMGSSKVSNVQVTCSANSYKVGGTILGLAGSVSLQNNGGDTLTQSSDSSFTFTTPVAQGASYHVTVSSQPASQTCTVNNGAGTMGGANVSDIEVDCVASNSTALSVSATGTIPVGSGSGSITVTNTGTTNTATNVSVNLPSGWTGVTPDPSNCTSIAPNNGTCTITFTTTTPYIAQGNIPVTGDNISNTPTTALAFTVDGYLVWKVTNATMVQVIDSINLAQPSVSNGITWTYGTAIGPGAQSFTAGATNTSAIVAALGTSSSYAAELCNQSVNGGASAGDWYLPAICQMGGSGQAAGCAQGLANINTNLVQLGFGALVAGDYWSSTEYSDSPLGYAWYQYVDLRLGRSYQQFGNKSLKRGVRCARGLTY